MAEEFRFSFFLAQTDLNILKVQLTAAFRKVAGIEVNRPDEVDINNLGLLYAHILNQVKLQNQLNRDEAQSFLQILDTHSDYKINFVQLSSVLNEPESLKDFLMNSCNEMQYVLLCQFIKFCYPDVRPNVSSMNNTRFEKVTNLEVPTPETVVGIQSSYHIRGVDITKLLLLERYGLAITLGTMTFTNYMMWTFKLYLDTNGRWGDIYKSKTLIHTIMPFIQLMMSDYHCDVDKKELLNLLLDFSYIEPPDKMDCTSLKSTLRFIESMVVEDESNLNYLERFITFLLEKNYRIVREGNCYRITISDEMITITYN